MGAVAQKITSAVPSAVTKGNSVPVNQTAQRGPYEPMTGSSYVPYVPGNEVDEETPWQPAYATVGKTGQTLTAGSTGAPSVPGMNGALFTPGAIDPHYTVPSAFNPYAKVNTHATRGMLTWVKAYANHVFNGKQNVSNTGWQQNSAQQRTSYMRITPPPHGAGYAPATSTPKQMPQQDRTYRFNPTTGNDLPGPRRGQGNVLNSTTYGAGQTAGGIGGSQYAPTPSGPDTVPVTSTSTSMPTWG